MTRSSHEVTFNSRAPTTRKFVRHLMKGGAKGKAERILREALEQACLRVRRLDANEILETALFHLRPVIGIKTRIVKGQKYQVPYTIPEKQGFLIAMRTLTDLALPRKGTSFSKSLGREILAAYLGERGPSPDGRPAKSMKLSTRPVYGGA